MSESIFVCALAVGGLGNRPADWLPWLALAAAFYVVWHIGRPPGR